MSQWEVVPGANGSVWVVDQSNRRHRHCYPHAPTVLKIERQRMRYPPFISEQRWQRLRSRIRLRAGDVIIATYPKSGTTWLEQIVLLLLEVRKHCCCCGNTAGL